MKRVLSLIMVFMMCISITAFADDYDILSTPINSYEADISVTMTVNEPMTVLNLISQASGIDNFVNLQQLAESLCNSKTTGVIKLNSNGDYTKMKMSYEVSEVTPIAVNRNLKLTAEMKLGMWLEWDITDELNPVIKYVIQQPFADKYMSVDLVDMMGSQGISVADFVSSIKGYLAKERVDELNRKLTDILRNNSSLDSKGNKITITITASQLENFIAELMDFMVAEFDDNEDFNLLHDGDFGYISEVLPDSEQVKEFFDEVQLFDETALVMEYVKTPNGALKSASSAVNLNIDLEKAFEYMDIQAAADVPKSLKFSIKSDVSYKSVNANVKVDFPVLTENDIINFDEYIYSMDNYDYDWDGENCYHDEYGHAYNNYIPAAKDTFYVTLSNITESHRSYGYDYAVTREGDKVTLTENSGKDCFSKAEMTVGSNEISVDGVSYTLPNPVIVSDAIIYIDTNALKYIFNLDLQYASVDLETNELTCSFNRRSPQCHHTEEEINSWMAEYDDSDECEHYQTAYVSSDYPYDGVGYIKIRDVLNEMYYYDETAYSVSYNNGVVTITDESASQGFSSILITVGSNEYVVDGLTITAGKPAVEYCDSVYIDVFSTLGIFGFEASEPYLSYERFYNEDGTIESSYMAYNVRLVRKSPFCGHTDEELEDYEKWWE